MSARMHVTLTLRTDGLPLEDALRENYIEEAKQLRENIRDAVFERDGFTCQACGFYSRKYHEVLSPHSQPAGIRDFRTLCIFCAQCFRLEAIGTMRSGLLVWLPEITQPQLHHLMRDIYRARITQGEKADTARQLLTTLVSRRAKADDILGTDNPESLAAALKAAATPPPPTLAARLADIRLLPLDRRIVKEADLEFNLFPQILAYWRSKDGPLSELAWPWLGYFYQRFFSGVKRDS